MQAFLKKYNKKRFETHAIYAVLVKMKCGNFNDEYLYRALHSPGLHNIPELAKSSLQKLLVHAGTCCGRVANNSGAFEWADWVPCVFGNNGWPRKVLGCFRWTCEFCDAESMKQLCVDYVHAKADESNRNIVADINNHLDSWPVEPAMAKACLESPGAQFLKWCPCDNAQYALENAMARRLWNRLSANCKEECG